MTRGRVVIAAAILFACTARQAAAGVLHVDVNGDASSDQIAVRVASHEILVTLSGRVQTIARLHTRAQLLRIVAADLDRDGDVDIVASTNSGLRFWINNGSGRFFARRPRRRNRLEVGVMPGLMRTPAGERARDVVPVSTEVAVSEERIQYDARGHPPNLCTSWLPSSRAPVAPVAPRGPPSPT